MTKSKKSPRCKKHPSRSAKLRCSRCGAWICNQCALHKKDKVYCSDSCASPPLFFHSSPQTNELVTSPEVRFIVLSLAFLTLCGTLFAIWSSLHIKTLKRENSALLIENSKLSEKLRKSDLKLTQVLKSTQKPPVVKTSIPPPEPRKQKARIRNLKSRLTPLGLPYTIDNGTTSKKLVALTFDGGSHANAATEILDTLASRNVQSTMFVTGRFIRKYPQIIKRAAREGHEIGNHTASHPRLTTYAQTKTHATRSDITRQSVIRELARAEEQLRRSTGLSFSPLWRAPYGEYNWEICSWAQEAGYLHIGWRRGRTWSENLDSNDWIPDVHTPGYKSPEQVMQKMTKMARSGELNGGIVLLHLGTVRKERSQQVHLILGQLIDNLRDQGYDVVTVTRLLQESNINVNLLETQKLANRTN